jgi:HAD superfamily hydrolase (TIGR01509 family)
MKERLIIFDLDGVLVDTDWIHFISFKTSLSNILANVGDISYTEYILLYDGIPTYDKIHKFKQRYNLDISPNVINDIYNEKQRITLELYSNIELDDRIYEMLNYFRKSSYLACCTNSNKKISHYLLKQLNIYELFDVVLTSDDVIHKKPNSEIYCKAINLFGVGIDNSYIIEDSPIGIKAAKGSGGKVIILNNYHELNIDFLKNAIEILKFDLTMNIYHNTNLNLVIPMAGNGQRFVDAGYNLPKPLIPIPKTPMIHEVYSHLNINSNCTFIIKKSHRLEYDIDKILNNIHPNCNIVEVDGVTQGSVESILLSEEHIDNDSPLIISNCDNIIIWDSVDFMYSMNRLNADGGIVCFKDTDTKWSFAKLNADNEIVEVAEKKPISDNATSGIYYWKRGSDFVKYAKQMISEDYRVNNEFYTAPVYNFAIRDGKRIYPYFIDKSDMWGVGDPESLDYYLNNYI